MIWFQKIVSFLSLLHNWWGQWFQLNKSSQKWNCNLLDGFWYLFNDKYSPHWNLYDKSCFGAFFHEWNKWKYPQFLFGHIGRQFERLYFQIFCVYSTHFLIFQIFETLFVLCLSYHSCRQNKKIQYSGKWKRHLDFL